MTRLSYTDDNDLIVPMDMDDYATASEELGEFFTDGYDSDDAPIYLEIVINHLRGCFESAAVKSVTWQQLTARLTRPIHWQDLDTDFIAFGNALAEQPADASAETQLDAIHNRHHDDDAYPHLPLYSEPSRAELDALKPLLGMDSDALYWHFKVLCR